MSAWLASVDPVWFAIAVVALSACSFLGLAALAWGGRAQAREIVRVEGELRRAERELRHEHAVLAGDVILGAVTLDEATDGLRKQKARLDRMQKMVEGMRRGKNGDWRDSLDLTRFNWKKPDPF